MITLQNDRDYLEEVQENDKQLAELISKLNQQTYNELSGVIAEYLNILSVDGYIDANSLSKPVSQEQLDLLTAKLNELEAQQQEEIQKQTPNVLESQSSLLLGIIIAVLTGSTNDLNNTIQDEIDSDLTTEVNRQAADKGLNFSQRANIIQQAKYSMDKANELYKGDSPNTRLQGWQNENSKVLAKNIQDEIRQGGLTEDVIDRVTGRKNGGLIKSGMQKDTKGKTVPPENAKIDVTAPKKTFAGKLQEIKQKFSRAKKIGTGVLSGRVKAKSILGMIQGRQWVAERIYRTESSRAINNARIESYKEAGITRITIVNEYGACSICEPLVGQVFTIEENENYETMFDLPQHPNCRCLYHDIPEALSEKGAKDYANGKKLEGNSGALDSTPQSKEDLAKANALSKKYENLSPYQRMDLAINIANGLYDQNGTAIGIENIDLAIDHLFNFKNPATGIGFSKNLNVMESFERLVNGDAKPHDVVMLRHEIVEADLIKNNGWNYRNAHEKANHYNNYQLALKDYQVEQAQFDNSKRWSESLTPAQYKAVADYTGKSHRFINGYLRTGQQSGNYDMSNINEISNPISNYKMNKPVTVYRGVSGKYANSIRRQDVGYVIHDKAFTSSSFSEQKAWALGHQDMVWEIQVPAGTGIGADLREFTGHKYPHQEEFLFQKGSKFEIISKSDNRIVVKYIGNNG